MAEGQLRQHLRQKAGLILARPFSFGYAGAAGTTDTT
jgi:hypothetical protein